MSAKATGTGIHFNAAARAREDRLRVTPGEHAWITVVAFRITTDEARRAHKPDGNVPLDAENIASISTGCLVCELPYSDRESYRRCKGEPSA